VETLLHANQSKQLQDTINQRNRKLVVSKSSN
jgi:hypothetical protein